MIRISTPVNISPLTITVNPLSYNVLMTTLRMMCYLTLNPKICSLFSILYFS